MEVVILGGGLAAITAAYYLQSHDEIEKIEILEKEDRTGGLCQSISCEDYIYDVGPHILFAKDKEALNTMVSLLDEPNRLRRSNQIIYQGNWIQYPFENDLSKLPSEDLQYCIRAFNNNPYEDYEASNMLQFFLKTFGEGITNTYLRPYNQKIWKYDPSFMNTDMVERIPKPTSDDIRRSAAGETVDGYVHQLYFSYPKTGGIESVVRGFEKALGSKCHINTNTKVSKIDKKDGVFYIHTADGEVRSSKNVISTIPVNELVEMYPRSPDNVKKCAEGLRYNSIKIAFVKTRHDLCGMNFAFMIPDKNVIFHRISKMDFLGAEYQSDGATYMVEITYRKNDHIDAMPLPQLTKSIIQGICDIGFAKTPEDVQIVDITDRQYAYVIYDLLHKQNMGEIRDYFDKEGLVLHGRFGNFEYWNMDKIVRESMELYINGAFRANTRI